MRDTATITQLEQTLIDEFFANLQRTDQPRQPEALPENTPRPHYQKSQRTIEREQIEDQLRMLIDASVTRLYAMLEQRLDELKKAQAERIETERQRSREEKRRTTSGLCTPSRRDWY